MPLVKKLSEAATGEQPEQVKCCDGHQRQQPQVGSTVNSLAGTRVEIKIMQMDCPTEERLIRAKLGKLPGIIALEFKLLSRVLTVVHQDADLELILKAIESLGYSPQVNFSENSVSDEGAKRNYIWLIGAALIAFASEAVGWIAGLPDWLSMILALSAVLCCGIDTYKKGWLSIIHFELNINALMSIAVTGAFVIGQWPEAAMVMVLFSLAEVIEQNSLHKAGSAIKGLLELTPAVSRVLQADGSWQQIATNQVTAGAIVKVKPGERISLDGVISKGSANIDQAPITGESIVVDKSVGDTVYAGTINGTTAFEFSVTAVDKDTTLAAIIRVVEQAQSDKAPIQRFIDKFASVYTPVVFAIAVFVAVIPPLFFSGDWQQWIYKALVLLVIACPCALVISTPVTIVSGLTAAARRGILIKGGVHLEQGRHIQWLALDKTGTITQGKPVLTDYLTMHSASSSGQTIEDYVQLALSLTSQSDHPVSNAVSQFFFDKNVQALPVRNFTALLGLGIEGEIENVQYYLGNTRLGEQLGLLSTEHKKLLAEYEQQGKTLNLLMSDAQVLALFAVADQVKEHSAQAIRELHQLQVKTVMLSGDNQHTAKVIAGQVGIDQVIGELLPEQKLQKIESLQKNAVVAMVGDGINDAPAIARADLGFAMGALGADTAIETADVALMDDDLRKIPEFIRLSAKVHRILVQNICFAIGVKVLFLVVTIAGFGDMWMAVFADVGASLLVVANGLRLLKK
ncbi:MAG: heavy metal translocating P-type ATPase [Osedax symbiont Rs1]|nr:MAG: heavy metal translocating P-type ATPase [Osedax symbiont Rs1]